MPTTEWQMYLYLAVVAVAFVAVASAAIAYGFLAPWWRSRTGIGFLSTKIAFTLIIFLTLIQFFGVDINYWVGIGSWLFVSAAMFWGVTVNILWKQYFEKRADRITTRGRRRNNNERKDKDHGTAGTD